MPNELPAPAQDNQSIVLAYHQRSKHQLQRYAAGPGTIDWEHQPNPFRRFHGADEFRFALAADQLSSSYQQLYTADAITPAPFSLTTLGAFFELSFALSAWKQYGSSRWSLRCNPSSGNLHPTETYAVLLQALETLQAGVYHYCSEPHALEQRCQFMAPVHSANTTGFVLGLSSIAWREAWKYGERAFRYCQLDTGHAIACADYAAATLGWRTRLIGEASDAQIATLLGLDRRDDFSDAEAETPELLLWVTPSRETTPVALELDQLTRQAQGSAWTGHANLLDPRPMYAWPVIDEVSRASEKTRGDITAPATPFACPPSSLPATDINMARLIRQRRSAQAYDGQTGMALTDFLRLLHHLLPAARSPVWRSWPAPARIQPVFFVHRVEGLTPGLYVQVRDPDVHDTLRAQLNAQFDWQVPGDAKLQPRFAELGFYHLVSANAQPAARRYACHQDIASDSAFAVSLLAPLHDSVATAPWWYRQLYWECGMLGQVMYLEAEASDLRATGIGCFFDDAVHQVLGIKDDRWQCLYQFTLGGALPDTRLITLPPYTNR